MSALFTVQAVVLVVGGYLIGVGFFRKRWTAPPSRRVECSNATVWASERALATGRRAEDIGTTPMCRGPQAAAADPLAYVWETRFCRECMDYSKQARKARGRGDSAWFWPIVGIGRAAMAVVRLGESLADVEAP